MTQLEQLWAYQAADVAADNAKKELTNSPQRKKLLQLRNSIKEQQTFLQTLEDEKAAMLDRLVVLKDAVKLSEGQLEQFHARVTGKPAQTAKEATAYVTEMQAIIDTLNDYDREIRRIRQSAANRERRHREVLQLAVKLKNDFDAQRETYNKEYQERSAKMDALRKAADEKAKGIDPKLLQRYNQVKEHSVPPMAKLVNDRCSGCNMSFPSSVLRDIQSGKEVECETCGRMIIP